MSTPCQRAHVILRGFVTVETGWCRPMSEAKTCEIKGLPAKLLVFLSYWNRWIIGS